MNIEITDAETLATRDLLRRVVEILNADAGAKFLVSRGKGASTVQCLRVTLSRIRKELEAKKIPQRRFRLHASVFPWTEKDGSRFDCVILSRNRTRDHKMLEALEALAING